MAEALLRIGTRGSKLALTQTGIVRDALARAHAELAAPGAIEIVVIRTTGDVIQDRPLSEAGGKGLFVKEIEEALLSGRIDAAVHSMKDMPTAQPDGLVITAFLPREDVRDVLIADASIKSIADLRKGAVVGTSALRRRAQLLHRRPDLQIVTLRGNVDTRIAKRERGEVEATLLALAGLKRLGLGHVGAPIPEDEMLPAVGQGAVCIECRSDDSRTRGLLAAIDHEGIDNIRLFDADALRLLGKIPPRSLARVFLLYPDPWPKRPQHKRRFVSDSTLASISEVLEINGEFRFATDIDHYAGWTLARVFRSKNLVWTAESAESWRHPWPHWIETRYEAKARREGRFSSYLTFKRV